MASRIVNARTFTCRSCGDRKERADLAMSTSQSGLCRGCYDAGRRLTISWLDQHCYETVAVDALTLPNPDRPRGASNHVLEELRHRPSAPERFPHILHWPTGGEVPRGDRVIRDPQGFVGPELVISEKLDGANTLLHRGEVYDGRSVSLPSTAGWHAMVKKHHGWKTRPYSVLVYGEDIFGIHSIEYEPVLESSTYYVFAIRQGDLFESYRDTALKAQGFGLETTPLLWRGKVSSIQDLDDLVKAEMSRPSVLGGEREGVVIRLEQAFSVGDFARSIAKCVRPGHVQSDEHWSRNWRQAQVIGLSK